MEIMGNEVVFEKNLKSVNNDSKSNIESNNENLLIFPIILLFRKNFNNDINTTNTSNKNNIYKVKNVDLSIVRPNSLDFEQKLNSKQQINKIYSDETERN